MRLRAIVAVCTLLLAGGCADILGIQDRYFDGGPASEGGLDASDVSAPDAPPVGCAPCTSYGPGCEVIACQQDSVSLVTVVGSRVFWANTPIFGADNEVISADLDGKNPAVAYNASSELTSLVGLQGNAYVATYLGDSIMAMPGSGGAAQSLVNAAGVYAIGVDGANGYFSYGTHEPAGDVWFCSSPSGCASAVHIAANQPNVGGVAVDATYVYWTTSDGLFRCANTSLCTSPLVLAPTAAASLVAVDTTYVYWVSGQGPYTLWRASKLDGTGTMQLDTSSSSILGLAVDGGYVYDATYGTGADGKIRRVKNDGTGATVLATGLVWAGGVAVDSTNVYFTEQGSYVDGSTKSDGRIMRMPR